MSSNTSISAVVVKHKTINAVVSKKANLGTINTDVPVTLKNVPTIISGGATSFDELNDVNLQQRTDGSVPVYDQPTNTYVVKHLQLSEIDGGFDGGTF